MVTIGRSMHNYIIIVIIFCSRYSIPEGEEIKAMVIGMVTCSDLQPRNSLATEWS